MTATFSVCLACLLMAAGTRSSTALSPARADSDRVTAVTLEQALSEALVRCVTNWIVVTGADLDHAKWLEAGGMPCRTLGRDRQRGRGAR
jgi:hypothetical protein